MDGLYGARSMPLPAGNNPNDVQLNNDILSPFTIPKPQERNKMDLQKMLIDERIRCDAHKTNYQVLKEEHKLLKEDFLKLQQDLNRAKVNNSETNENLQDVVHDLRSQLASKSRELEEVRSQGLNPQRLEIIKAEITKELEGPMKEHVRSMDQEVEKYRNNYNKLRYDYEFIKSETEHMKANHKRILDELILRHQTQVAALEQEKESFLKQQNNSQTEVDIHKIQTLQRQKIQLEQKVRNLIEENSEIRKQKEASSVEADSIQRTQAKDIAQLQGNLKSIESEKRSADVQCERLQKELQSNSEHNTRLTQQIQDLNKECSSLRNMADEESHKHKMLLTNHKMEMMAVKGDLEREKDDLVAKLRRFETEVELLKSDAEQHTKQMEEAEREFARSLQKAREEEWRKNHILQTEKMDLEAKCNELERQLTELKTDQASEREQTEEKIRLLEMNENQMHSEMQQLKHQIDKESRIAQLLEKEQSENSSLRQKLHDKDLELQTMNLSKNQVLQDIQRAREVIKSTKIEAEENIKRAKKAEENAEKTMEDQRVYGMEEKHRLQSRINELEHKMKRLGEDMTKKEHKSSKVQRMMAQKVRSMKSKNQLLEAEKERLEIELKAGRHGVSMEEHHRMRRKLADMRNRLREFHRIISTSDQAYQLGTQARHPFTSTLAPGFEDETLPSRLFESHIDAPVRDHDTELSQIIKRIDDVAEKQKLQNEELDIVKQKPAVSHDNRQTQEQQKSMKRSTSIEEKYSYSSDSFESENSK